MTPRRIIRRAAEMGLDMIAISDHNSAENIDAAMKAADEEGMAVLPAMEVSSSEEAHVLALFDNAEKALQMQETVYRNLAGDVGGGRDWQVVVNEKDEVMGFNKKMLIGATGLTLGELLDEVHASGGLCIASHVDRGAFSVMSQFGFVPENLRFDAFEVINPEAAEAGLVFHPGVPRVRSSDAHRLEDVGARATSFMMEEATFEELAMALRAEGGRSVQDR
jgi:predicted metal-dependent phosphoesterase TrpH